MTQGWKKITDSGVGLGGQVALLGHSNINTIRIYTLLRHLILRSGDLPRDRRFSCIAKYYGDIRLKSIDYQPNKRRLRNSMVLVVRNFPKIIDAIYSSILICSKLTQPHKINSSLMS